MNKQLVSLICWGCGWLRRPSQSPSWQADNTAEVLETTTADSQVDMSVIP